MKSLSHSETSLSNIKLLTYYIIIISQINIKFKFRKEPKMSKTNLQEINRNIYDIKNKDKYEFKIKKGLTPEIIKEL